MTSEDDLHTYVVPGPISVRAMPAQAVPRKAASALVRRHPKIRGRYTTVHLGKPILEALGEIAVTRDTTRSGLIEEIDQTRSNANLSLAIRVFVLAYYQASGR